MRQALLAIPVALFALGVARADEAKPFPHKLHLDDGMECGNCHNLKKLDAKGLPTLNEKRCGKCHDGEVPAYLAPKGVTLAVPFPHAKHAEAEGLECAACHVGAPQDKPEVAPAQAQCVSCHAEKKVKLAERDCAACHGTDQRRVKPADHAAGWLKKHGVDARWKEVAGHGEGCDDCHAQGAAANSCKSCHHQMMPADHNGLWRVRAHGQAAGWDRDRCRTCHEPGTCVGCHKTTRPMNHTGNWMRTHGLAAGGASNESCGVCHQQSACTNCHSGR